MVLCYDSSKKPTKGARVETGQEAGFSVIQVIVDSA
jgi:hypothetical protein